MGYYRLEVTDPQTGLTSGYRFRAGWDPGATTMAGRPDRIGMALDKQAYSGGDEVSVAIQPPAAGKGFCWWNLTSRCCGYLWIFHKTVPL
ncbi:hypothetical protein [Aliamphritea spongicola]|nr:hypothetical protein [Aliamphritea spongicola]